MIKIAEYGITADEHSFSYGIVKTSTDKKTGEVKEFISNPRYCNTVQACLASIAQRKQRELVQSIDCDLKSAVHAITASNDAFTELVRKTMAGTGEV